MNVLFDGSIASDSEVRLSCTDRGFQYGDGIFETIVCQGTVVSFLDLHWERLTKGMNILKLALPDWLSQGQLETAILKLMQLEGLETARVKLLAWRKKGGLYTPSQNSAHLLIMALPHQPPIKILKVADICRQVRLAHSSISSFKTLSSMPYVLAGIEKKQRKLDELILLDREDRVSECTASNIFWIKDNRLFTPPLESGCIEGIRRRSIMDRLGAENPVKQVSITVDELLEADQVFNCNVTGIQWIRTIREHRYDLNHIDQLKSAFKLYD